jgi:tetratricopeptide (TPR) repeat protein
VLYAIFLGGIGSPQALSEIQYALKLDPTSLFPNHAAAWLYLFGGGVEEAEAQARHTIELFPDALHGYFVLGWAAWLQDRHAEAVAETIDYRRTASKRSKGSLDHLLRSPRERRLFDVRYRMKLGLRSARHDNEAIHSCSA